MIEALFGFIARLIAVVLALVFVVATLLVLQARTADRVLLDPLTYQLALAETNTWLKLPDLVTAEVENYRADLPEPDPADVPNAVFHALEPQDLRALTALLLPAPEVQRLAEDAIDQSLAFATMKRDDIVLDLGPLKRNAAGKAGVQAVEILAGALPECGAPECPSAGEIAAAVDPQQLVGQFPDALPVVTGPEDPDPREQFALARSLLGFAPLVLLVLLALVALFGARSRAGWLRWTGVPLLLAGLIAVGAAAAAGPAIDLAWSELALQVDDPPSPVLVAQLRAVFDAVAAELVRHLQFEGGAVALLGFALTLFSFFVPDRRAHGT